MSNVNRDISFYVDTMIVEALIEDDVFYKTADGTALLASLVDKVRNYVGAHIDENDRFGSVLKILGPGAFFMFIRNVIGGPLAFLLTVVADYFNIGVAEIIASIWNNLKSSLDEKGQIAPEQLKTVVNQAVTANVSPMTQENADETLKAYSFNNIMRDTRMVKLTMIELKNNILHKNAFGKSRLVNGQLKTTNVLIKVLTWLFQVVFYSAGIMVTGDVVNKMTGKPNAFDGSLQSDVPTGQRAAVVIPPTTQTVFKPNPAYKLFNYTSMWTEPGQNTESSIGQMLIRFAKDVYSGLEGKESLIQSTAGFQAIQDKITFYNRMTEGSPQIFIPPEFISKKQIVDYFIDDVAEKA